MCSALTGSNRFASWLKFAPGEFVILGVLAATLRVASRSKIAPGDFVNSGPCLPKALGRLQAIVFNRHAGDARGRKCLTSHNGSGLIPAIFRHAAVSGSRYGVSN